jgi:hypothetical protein
LSRRRAGAWREIAAGTRADAPAVIAKHYYKLLSDAVKVKRKDGIHSDALVQNPKSPTRRKPAGTNFSKGSSGRIYFMSDATFNSPLASRNNPLRHSEFSPCFIPQSNPRLISNTYRLSLSAGAVGPGAQPPNHRGKGPAMPQSRDRETDTRRCDWIGCLESDVFDSVQKWLLNAEGRKNITETPRPFVFLCTAHFQLAVGTSE